MPKENNVKVSEAVVNTAGGTDGSGGFDWNRGLELLGSLAGGLSSGGGAQQPTSPAPRKSYGPIIAAVIGLILVTVLIIFLLRRK